MTNSPRVDVLLWARRITGRRSEPPHKLLEIAHDASLDDAQNAFHKIARMAHPDLHRTTLNAEELELVTVAYSLAASAYQQFRSQKGKPAPAKDRTKRPSGGGGVVLPGGGVVGRGRTPSSAPAPAPSPAPPAVVPEVSDFASAPGTGASKQMSSKALVHYRKAESSLRQGDLRAAVLQLKMAIAADPQSTFLRTALTEVQAELAKPP